MPPRHNVLNEVESRYLWQNEVSEDQVKAPPRLLGLLEQLQRFWCSLY